MPDDPFQATSAHEDSSSNGHRLRPPIMKVCILQPCQHAPVRHQPLHQQLDGTLMNAAKQSRSALMYRRHPNVASMSMKTTRVVSRVMRFSPSRLRMRPLSVRLKFACPGRCDNHGGIVHVAVAATCSSGHGVPQFVSPFFGHFSKAMDLRRKIDQMACLESDGEQEKVNKMGVAKLCQRCWSPRANRRWWTTWRRGRIRTTRTRSTPRTRASGPRSGSPRTQTARFLRASESHFRDHRRRSTGPWR